MQSSIESLEGLKRKLTVIIPVEDVQKAYESKLKTIAKSAKMDGFRPGKVPTDVLEKKHGQDILQDVAGELMESGFTEAIKKDEIKVAGPPRVEPNELKKDQPIEFTATFEVYPEIQLVDLSGKKIEKAIAELKDDDIEKMLERMQRQQAEWKVAERACQSGDRVKIDFEGFIDGEAFEGGKAEGFQLELGSGQMIPGFEDGITGMKADEEKDIEVTFPKEYPAENLAGKASLFKIKLHEVEEPALPELNDEFAKKVGFDSMEKMREEARKNMQGELERVIAAKLKENVLDKLIEVNKFDVPAALIDTEIRHLQNMTRQQMAQGQPQNQEQLAKMELPREPYVEQAEKRVILGLLLAEIIKQHELKVDADKVRAKVDELAAAYAKPEEVVAWYYNNKNMLAEIEAVVLEEMAVQKLLEPATINEKALAYDELMKSMQK